MTWCRKWAVCLYFTKTITRGISAGEVDFGMCLCKMSSRQRVLCGRGKPSKLRSESTLFGLFWLPCAVLKCDTHCTVLFKLCSTRALFYPLRLVSFHKPRL